MKRSIVAFFVCLFLVLGALGVWEATLGRFNPNPASTTAGVGSACPRAGVCGSFAVTDARLTFANLTDIQTQALTVTILPGGGFPVANVQALLDNYSLGTVVGPFAAGRNETVVFAVPTTIDVESGASFALTLVGTYTDAATGATVGTFVATQNVTASQSVVG